MDSEFKIIGMSHRVELLLGVYYILFPIMVNENSNIVGSSAVYYDEFNSASLKCSGNVVYLMTKTPSIVTMKCYGESELQNFIYRVFDKETDK